MIKTVPIDFNGATEKEQISKTHSFIMVLPVGMKNAVKGGVSYDKE